MNERAEVRLPELPSVVLSSSEEDVLGQWTIFYTWEKTDTRQLTFTVGEYEVSGLVGQAEEKAEKEGAPFDLAEARRQAADRLVVGRIRPVLDPRIR
jgi:hypothetical protein